MKNKHVWEKKERNLYEGLPKVSVCKSICDCECRNILLENKLLQQKNIFNDIVVVVKFLLY